MHHATAGSLLGIPGVAWFWVLTVLGVGGVVVSLGRRFELLRLGRADNRFDRIGERIRQVLVYAFGQRKMFDDPFAGVYHLLIFYGFLVVSLRTVAMVLEGLFGGWELPLLHTPVGHAYLFSKDLFELAEERFKAATGHDEKLEALREMIALLPKHKGTEKMLADLRKRLAKLENEPSGRRITVRAEPTPATFTAKEPGSGPSSGRRTPASRRSSPRSRTPIPRSPSKP